MMLSKNEKNISAIQINCNICKSRFDSLLLIKMSSLYHYNDLNEIPYD